METMKNKEDFKVVLKEFKAKLKEDIKGIHQDIEIELKKAMARKPAAVPEVGKIAREEAAAEQSRVPDWSKMDPNGAPEIGVRTVKAKEVFHKPVEKKEPPKGTIDLQSFKQVTIKYGFRYEKLSNGMFVAVDPHCMHESAFFSEPQPARIAQLKDAKLENSRTGKTEMIKVIKVSTGYSYQGGQIVPSGITMCTKIEEYEEVLADLVEKRMEALSMSSGKRRKW
jgi:hypothetical protein